MRTNAHAAVQLQAPNMHLQTERAYFKSFKKAHLAAQPLLEDVLEAHKLALPGAQLVHEGFGKRRRRHGLRYRCRRSTVVVRHSGPIYPFAKGLPHCQLPPPPSPPHRPFLATLFLIPGS